MYSNNIFLDGKIALVTGGSRGIGRAIALGLAKSGVDVAVTSRKLPDLENVAGEIRKLGRKSLAAAADVGSMEQIPKLVDKVQEEFGRIDILVNNAGINITHGPLIDAEEREWDEMLNVNLKGPFLLGQLAARIMREHGGGNIVNISSVAGIKARSHAIYGVAKAGVIMLTGQMAKEWGQFNIRVNAIAPGGIKTRLNEELWADPARAEEVAKETALLRWGEPEDIAQTTLFLVSDASRHITGETIVVDGGEMVGSPPLFSN